MTKPKILLQLDAGTHPSVFDSVVAIDAGVDHLLTHGGIEPTEAQSLVHGAMFTRGPADLKNTAIFIGGSNVSAGESLLEQVKQCFFGPMRVSVMLDANGANTTASAAVLAAARHVELQGAEALVLAATGPVGQRVVRLLAKAGANVRVASRSLDRAREVCATIQEQVAGANLSPVAPQNAEELRRTLDGVAVVFAAGAAGVELLSLSSRKSAKALRVAIDLNAVSPLGIEGIGVADKAVEKDGVVCYGAVGVGGTKMKIHKAAIRRLFESNDAVLDADEIYAIGQQLEQAGGERMAKKKILMLVGDYVEDYEVMVPYQMLLLVGHDVHAVCPGKSAGDVVATAIHDFEGQQTYSEKRGHNFRVTTDFDAVNEIAYDALVIPGGRSPEYLRMNERVRAIVRHFAEAKKPIAAICHGAQLLAGAGVLKGKARSAYPACQAEVELGGGKYVPAAETFDNAHTHDNLVSAPAWPAHPEWMRQFLALLGTKITP